MKIVSIVGTRPNFMKIAALVDEIKKHKEIEQVLVHTGQHYDEEMSKLFFDELEIPKPDINLGVGSGNHEQQIKNIITKLKDILTKEKPDLVIVVGDVNSTVAGAEAANELDIKVAHVEAGLRSFDKTMPEENNRIRTDEISDFLFTTEKSGNENLLKEGISKDKIFFVGNVMIDTLLRFKEKANKSKIFEKLKEKENFDIKNSDYCVLTLHRPSNVDKKETFENILYIIDKIRERIPIVFPMHLRTINKITHFGYRALHQSRKNLPLIGPLGYLDFIHLMSKSKLVLTDSGGIQEETTVLGIPCITLRKNTERPVTVEQGTNLLVSIEKEKVVEKAMDILDNKIKTNKKIPELWDGKAAKRILDVILNKFKK